MRQLMKGLIALALIACVSGANAQQQGFRIIDAVRDSYGNAYENFRCPDGSGGFTDPISDFNRDGQRNCHDLAASGAYTELLILIAHTFQNWERPRSLVGISLKGWEDISIVPGLRIFRYDVANFCTWIVLRRGDDRREYIPGDLLLPHYGAAELSQAAVEQVKNYVRAGAAACERPTLDGWGFGGAIAATATVELRLDERNHRISSTVYSAPWVTMMGGGYHPFIKSVYRGFPYLPRTGTAISPRIWVLPKARGVGVQPMISDLQDAFRSTRLRGDYLSRNAGLKDEAFAQLQRAQNVESRQGVAASAPLFAQAAATHEGWMRGQMTADREAAARSPEVLALYRAAARALAAVAASKPDDRNAFAEALIAADRIRARRYGDASGAFGAFMVGGALLPSDVDSYLRSLPEGHAIVSLADVGDAVVVLAANGIVARVHVLKIESESFDLKLKSLQASLADPSSNQTALETGLLQLSNSLFDPLREIIGPAKRIMFTPDGRLALLPPTVLSRPGQAYAPFGLTADVVLTPSVRSRMSKLRAPPDWYRGFLGIADPEYPAVIHASGASRALPTGAATPGVRLRAVEGGVAVSRLPETRRELAAIAALAPARETKTLLTGRQASPAGYIRTDRSRLRYLHIATHGVLANEVPGLNEPALILAAGPDGNSLLRLSDIETHVSTVRLTVLSACSTGTGDLVAGEGVLGLARAFLWTGSRNVVASFWPVNSLATERLMVAFYRHDVAVDDPAASLRRAMVEIRRTNAHPFYWGAFSVFE